MHKQRIQHLLQLYAANQASREEVEELFGWLKEQEGDDALKKFIFEAAGKEVPNTTLHQNDWDRIWQSVESATTAKPKAPAKIVRPFWTSRMLRITAAALVLVMAGWAWLWFSRPKPTSAPVVAAVTIKKDISPGGNKAILTLADNSTIVLDSAANGKLAQQGPTAIIKLSDGQLTYAVSNSPSTGGPVPPKREDRGEALYNTVTTPHGGQFQLVLPDGTKVWLNAGSSLYFPATFSASKRMVQLTGEAYFEVTPHKTRPFIVKTRGGGEVQVLGTHFNVNAYDDEEAIKTTLLEGKVKVASSEWQVASGKSKPASRKEEVILKPGEQAVLGPHSLLATNHSPNIQQVIAWKNGYFRFKETGIRELMRQVERWYDVEVEYRTERNDQHYTGVVSRSKNISALLQTLELTGTVHFQIDNSTAGGKKGKIIVLP